MKISTASSGAQLRLTLFLVVGLLSCRNPDLVGADALLRVSPTQLDFPVTLVGDSTSLRAELTNPSRASQAVPVQVPAPFVGPASLEVPGGETVSFELLFLPTTVGTFSKTVTLGAGQVSLRLELTGTATAPITCAPAPAACRAMKPQQGRCSQSEPAPLRPAWRYQSAGGELVSPGVGDRSGNVFWLENIGSTTWLVSVDFNGTERFRTRMAGMPNEGSTYPPAMSPLMLVSDTQLIVLLRDAGVARALDASSGALAWTMQSTYLSSAIADEDTVYASENLGRNVLHATSSSGAPRWSLDVSRGGAALASAFAGTLATAFPAALRDARSGAVTFQPTNASWGTHGTLLAHGRVIAPDGNGCPRSIMVIDPATARPPVVWEVRRGTSAFSACLTEPLFTSSQSVLFAGGTDLNEVGLDGVERFMCPLPVFAPTTTSFIGPTVLARGRWIVGTRSGRVESFDVPAQETHARAG